MEAVYKLGSLFFYYWSQAFQKKEMERYRLGLKFSRSKLMVGIDMF